jgi:EPS-associated MarR family transcriptional regulator
MLKDEIRHQVLRLLEAKPQTSQRDLARELRISLGKVNSCVQALVREGCLKVVHSKNNGNKVAYTYLLTRSGVREKARLAAQFLVIKMREYEKLRIEIEQMKQETRGRILI